MERKKSDIFLFPGSSCLAGNIEIQDVRWYHFIRNYTVFSTTVNTEKVTWKLVGIGGENKGK